MISFSKLSRARLHLKTKSDKIIVSEEVVSIAVLDSSSTLDISTPRGCNGFDRAVRVITDDADRHITANNIVKFERVAVAV